MEDAYIHVSFRWASNEFGKPAKQVVDIQVAERYGVITIPYTKG